MKQSVAILVDSGTDVPQEFIERYDIFSLPLVIQYKDQSYLDKIEITADEVYARLPQEIPTTSLPSPGMIKKAFHDIIARGYEKVIAITISSGLSGTYNAIRLAAEEFLEVETLLLDTKNIGIGAGFAAILTGQLIEKGFSFAEIKKRLLHVIPNTKVFFCVNTLEYLLKGGRIGLVTNMIGKTLGIKPIISCNEDGIYYTVSKSRGRVNSLKKAMSLAEDFTKGAQHYNIAIAHGNVPEEAKEISQAFCKLLPKAEMIIEGPISPTLGVHTGPGLIGVGVQCLDFSG